MRTLALLGAVAASVGVVAAVLAEAPVTGAIGCGAVWLLLRTWRYEKKHVDPLARRSKRL